MEDQQSRDHLCGQSKLGGCPIEYTDYSVKKPWDSAWTTECRKRIKGCEGVIAMLSKNTRNADGARWEIKCAIEEGVPVLGCTSITTTTTSRPRLPARRSSGGRGTGSGTGSPVSEWQTTRQRQRRRPAVRAAICRRASSSSSSSRSRWRTESPPTITVQQFHLWQRPLFTVGVFEAQEDVNSRVLARFSNPTDKLFAYLQGQEEDVVGYIRDRLE